MRNADMGLLVQTLTRGWRGKGGRAGIAERLQWRREGDAARDAKNWTAAAHAYERHLNLTPEDHAIWVQYGHALKEAGSFERALAAYEQADLLKPSDRDLTTHLHHLRQQLAAAAQPKCCICRHWPMQADLPRSLCACWPPGRHGPWRRRPRLPTLA